MNVSLAHPVLRDMLNSGCQTHSNILLAFETYMELCEAHLLNDVQYEFCPELDIIYLTAGTEEKEYYVPVSVKKSISPKWIQHIQNLVSKNKPSKEFNLVIRDSDTTHTIYKLSSGLIPPLSPESSRKKKANEEKKQFVEAEIHKKLPQLYEEALEKKKG